MVNRGGASVRRGQAFRAMMMVGTTLAGGAVAATPSSAENISSNGSASYSLTRTDTVSGGPKTIDITTSGGDITLNLATVEVANSTGTPGVAISAVNSGSGNVSIIDARINGTGTTESAGISAQAVGDIVVSSGIVAMNQATASGGIGVQTTNGTVLVESTSVTAGSATGIAAYGKQVRVNSGTVNTREIGIDAGNGGGINADLVQVVSGTVNVNGTTTFTSGAIQAGGKVVDVTSGTITTSGTGNRFGISAQAVGTDASSTVTVRSGSVSTVGNGGYGIAALGYNGAVSITSAGTITTTGTTRMAGSQPRYAAGVIGVSNVGSVTIDSNNITTSGTASDGIRVETGSGIASYTTPTTPGTAPATVTSRGTISTSGNTAAGIRILPGTGNAIVSNLGTINTTGEDAYGVFVDARGGATTVTSNIVKTTGVDANGISVGANGSSNSNGTVAITSTRVDVGVAIGIAAYGKQVSITSDTVNSGEIGIDSGTTTGFTPDLVKIVSGTVNIAGTTNFVGGGITAGANVVDVTSGTIVTSGTGNRFGISAQAVGSDSSSTATVRSGSISTVGNGAYGIAALGYNGAVNVTSTGTITTTGTTRMAGSQARYSAGIIGVSNVGSVTIDSNNITTSGAASDGIRVETGSGIVSYNAPTTPGTAPSTVTSRGTISTSGSSAAGIRILSGTSNATVANSGTITTSGSTGHGITIDAKGGNTTVTSNIITTTGSGANGIVIGESGLDTGAVRITSSRIDAAANGIVANTTGSIEINSTNIAAHSYGMNVLGGDVVINSGTVTSAVATSTNVNALLGIGIAANSSGSISINSSQVTMSGSGSGGAYGIGTSNNGNGTTTITSGSVTSFGNGYAIGALTSGTGKVTITSTGAVVTTGTTRIAGTQPRYANGIWVVSPLSDVAIINSGTITTSGASASGIAIESGAGAVSYGTPAAVASDKTVTVASTGTITTAGANAHGINITAGGNAVTVASGTITTTGAGANGIYVSGTGTVNISAGTTSSAASGIFSRGGTTTLNAVQTMSSADGQHAIYAEALTGTIDATIGSAKATGAGSDAVHLVANGAGGAVTANITGTVSAASGNGLFIDPPGTVNVNIAAGANVSGSVAGVNVVSATLNTIVNAGTVANNSGGAAIVANGAANLSNSGVITAGTGGVAVQLSGANDTVTLRNGSAVTGTIAGGGGVDRAVLNGTGTITSTAQTVAAFSGFDSLTTSAGYWTAGATSSSFNSVNVANGATLEVRGAATGGLTGVVTSNYVADGTLAIRSTGNTGASVLGSQTVSGAGTVLFTGGTSSLSSVNGITTTGGIAVDNGATLLLTGTQGGKMNVLTGGTFTIGNGTTAGLFTGDANVAGTLIVNHSDDYNFTGGLTGAGSLVKQGAGKLTLGTGYAFTGTTSILGGSIKLAGTVAPTTELDLQGTGTLDFSGTRQTVAELAGNSAAASINVAQGALTVNQTTSTAFAGAITGDGALTKTGTGTLNLTGASTYTGPTTVTGGKLAVNGSIVSPVTVSGGGKLGGVGRVGNVTIGAGGAYAPGNSIGTQNVAGNVVFASGSTYEVETNADGRSDRIIATGTANIATNTTVAVLAEAGNYNRLTTYNILSATGGVTGTFTNVTSNFAFLTPSLSYTSTAVTLRLLRNDVTFASLARTPNQLAVANAINAQGFSGAVYNAAIVLPNGNVPAAYNELTGELFAAVPSVLLDQSRRIRGAVLDRADVDGEGWGIWGQAGRAGIETDATANVSATATDRTTVLSGVDYGMGAWRVGLHAGYVDSDVGVKGRASQANVHTKLVGAYGRWSQDALTVKVGGDYSWHDIKTTRSIVTPGIAGTERAGYDATSQQLFGEVSYALLNGPVTAAPFGGLAYVRTHSDQVVETGSAAALTVASRTRDVTLATAGWHLGGSAPITSNATLLPHLTASFQYAWGDLRGGSVATFGGVGQTFGVAGARLAQATYGLDGGVDVQFGKSVKAGIGGFMSTSRDWSDFGANVSVSFAF